MFENKLLCRPGGINTSRLRADEGMLFLACLFLFCFGFLFFSFPLPLFSTSAQTYDCAAGISMIKDTSRTHGLDGCIWFNHGLLDTAGLDLFTSAQPQVQGAVKHSLNVFMSRDASWYKRVHFHRAWTTRNTHFPSVSFQLLKQKQNKLRNKEIYICRYTYVGILLSW